MTSKKEQIAKGVVYLIGAGPGDPGLLTLRGRELLSSSDVVIYDRLVHPALLEYARPDAIRIFAGKASAQHTLSQMEINALLVKYAQEGKQVARLKGGDPFVFGRGGEEAEACRAAGVPFVVVPGITSAIAAPAYAGIPVTHRDAASSFCVITGHERSQQDAMLREAGAAEQRRNWATLAHAADTLVFLMGVEALPEIVSRLQENGRSPNTPIALVQWGTWPQQKVVAGCLADIVERVQKAALTPPAVCVVGEVVRLRDSLRWFDDPDLRPLWGKRVVVTRAREQASSLSEKLRALGADVLEYPTIQILPTENLETLHHALRHLASYSWMIVTSVNTVPILAKALETLEMDARAFSQTKIAAIGPATATALKHTLGLRADFVPSEAVAEGLLEEWPEGAMQGKKVLLPRALEARDLLPQKLREFGAKVDVIPVYQTIAVEQPTQLMDDLYKQKIDVITFTASSTVKNFMRALGIEMEGTSPIKKALENVLFAAIGPITAKTLQEYGFVPSILAEEHTIPGLVCAIEAYFRKRNERYG